MSSSVQDHAILRELAKQVAEIAALPVQQETIALWKALNALKPVRPMVAIDQVCWNEMNVDDELTCRCEDGFCRGLEWRLRATLYSWRHMRADNVALATTRSVEIGQFEHVFCSRQMLDHHAVSLKEVNYLFPLYLRPNGDFPDDLFAHENGRVPNLGRRLVAELAAKLGHKFVPDGRGNFRKTFGPEDVFHYAYAVFHSPTYRARYAEFLKTDFPRLPLTGNIELFRALAAQGAELTTLHLMQSPKLDEFLTDWPVKGDNVVEKVRYTDNDRRVWINKTQYFGGVPPEVWAFRIGGYQVCDKWLKDRKGRKLSYDDTQHYQRIVVALHETLRCMAEIDRIVEQHGGWPLK